MYWGINARIVIGGVLATLLFIAGWTVNGWRLESKYQREIAQSIQQARDTEHRLIEAADQTRKQKDAEIKAINDRLALVTGELRKRPSRTNQSTTTCPGGTGSSLYAEDGEFLIGEAARADKLRQALKECYERYETLKNELNK